MKKFLLALSLFLGTASFVSAQTKPVPSKTAKTARTATDTTMKMKKDGTPDKRYKSSQADVRKKKDGTPDMRYKENKKTTKP